MLKLVIASCCQGPCSLATVNLAFTNKMKEANVLFYEIVPLIFLVSEVVSVATTSFNLWKGALENEPDSFCRLFRVHFEILILRQFNQNRWLLP